MNINEWAEYCRAEKLGEKCRQFEEKILDCAHCDPFRCSEFLDGFGMTCRKTPQEIRAVGYYFGDPHADSNDECGCILYQVQTEAIRKYLRSKRQPVQLTLF
jgi:hypothetical protein